MSDITRLEAQALLASIVESSNDGIVSKTLDGIVTSWNKAAERIFGYTAAEMIGKPITTLFPPDRINEEKEILSRIRRRERVEHFESVRITKDGRHINVSATVSPILDSDGRVIAASKVVRDVTEQKRVLHEMRLSEQRLRLAMAGSRLGDWSWDVQTDQVVLSDRAADIFGIDPASHLTTWASLRDMLHPEDTELAQHAVEQAIASKGDYDIVYRVHRPDGKLVWVSAMGRGQYDSAGQVTGMIGVVQDVTEQRAQQQTQRFLVQLNDSLRAAATAQGVMWEAAFAVGTFMRVSRCTYGEIDAEQARVIVHRDFTDGVVSVAGSHELDAFGPPLIRELKLGRTVVVNDVATDPRTAGAGDEAFAAIQTRSIVCVPLIKESRFAALFVVNHAHPREWTSHEVRLLEQVAERTWFAVEAARAQDALVDSEQRLRLGLEAGNTGTWDWDITGGRMTWSDRLYEFHGVSREQWGGTIDDFRRLIHPDDAARVNTAIDAAIRTGDPYKAEFRVVRPSGAVRWLASQGKVFYDDAGKPLRMLGATTDITDRMRTEAALRQSEARLRAVVEATPECVKIVSPEGALLYMNAAGLCMIEADAMASVQDACVFDLVAPEHRPDWIERHRRVCGGEKLTWEFEIIGLNGTRRWMETHAVPLPLSDGRTGQLAVTREITARKRAESDREQLLERERAARVEAERASRVKDEFLATLSHEIRTPLNAILGWATILGSGDTSPDDMREGLTTIERNARAQTQIIEDLLDMSRIVSGKIRLDVQRLDLAPIVKSAIDTVTPAANARGVRLQAVLDPHAGPVSGDPGRLQQVFWNLLNNAVKFTPRGGRVHVVLERTNSHLEVSVVDTGEGIETGFLPHVFDRFRQADSSTTRRHGGLGLGLAIVKQLVELHGGTVRVKSAGKGTGSTFTVALPLLVLHPEPGRSSEAPRRHPRTVYEAPRMPEGCANIEGVRVLVVDDEPDARAVVQRLLANCDAIVETAGSVSEALDKLRAGRFDLLVSDIGMPGEDGYSLIRRVRSLSPGEGGNIPALALTAYARAEDRMNSIIAGFQMHVPKPVEPAELITMVASLTRQRQTSLIK